MAISFKKYINITSGVGGTSNVGQRSLCGRIFSRNNLIPSTSVLEFTSAEDVGTYFGTNSEEYARASNPYFSFISKNITTPQLLSFAYFEKDGSPPIIYGDKSSKSVIPFQFISDGTLSITIGAVNNTISSLDFTSVLTLSDVASIIQTELRATYPSDTMWSACFVTYEPIRGSFNFQGGDQGYAEITVNPIEAFTDISGLLGWVTPIGNGSGTILSGGSGILTTTDILTASSDVSNNFGSFVFTTDLIANSLTLADLEEAASWNDLQNVMYKFMLPVTPANAAAWSSAFIGYSGTCLTLVPSNVVTEFQEMADMTILAATDYNARNSTQNYMFQTNFTFTPTVTDTPTSNLYDSLRINYWGNTQNAGNIISFYQRGVLTGSQTDPQDSNVYSNEQWFKSAASSALMSVLISLPKVSANEQGISQILATLDSVIQQSLTNGTISVGKPLTNTQILFINSVTGNTDGSAWQQVQNIGYWVGAEIEEIVTQSSTTEYRIVYTLVYSKDDVVRQIVGRDILI